MRACLAAARTAKTFPVIMKWFYAGLALSLGAFIAGLASIILGYRQVIGNYIRDKQTTDKREATDKRGLTRI